MRFVLWPKSIMNIYILKKFIIVENTSPLAPLKYPIWTQSIILSTIWSSRGSTLCVFSCAIGSLSVYQVLDLGKELEGSAGSHIQRIIGEYTLIFVGGWLSIRWHLVPAFTVFLITLYMGTHKRGLPQLVQKITRIISVTEGRMNVLRGVNGRVYCIINFLSHCISIIPCIYDLWVYHKYYQKFLLYHKF